MIPLDDIPEDEIARAAEAVAAEISAHWEAQAMRAVLGTYSFSSILMPEPTPLYVPEQRSSWFEPYYTGMVMPASFPALVYCSADSGPDLRGASTERARWIVKMERAERGYRRATTRGNRRRRRYWANCVGRLSRRFDALFT